MNSVIEYIMENYTWIIVGSIILLLAIIGGYADKTNFGQGKNKISDENPDNEENNLIDKPISQINKEIEKKVDQPINKVQQVNSVPIVSNNIQPIIQNNQTLKNGNVQQVQTVPVNNNPININQNGINVGAIEANNYNDFNDKFDKFDEEFNSILPKKDIIDDSLLEDIDNLSFDKTQKLDLSIPDLDDVELPRIGNIDTEQKKIWKK